MATAPEDPDEGVVVGKVRVKEVGLRAAGGVARAEAVRGETEEVAVNQGAARVAHPAE